MDRLIPLRHIPKQAPWSSKDVLVLFGELFQKGYANGLVEEAEKLGMKVIRATVGRREAGVLRPLNEEEAKLQKSPFINIPLEAGFDLEPCSTGETPVDLLKDIKLSEWDKAQLDMAKIKESQHKGQERFRKNTSAFLKAIESEIPVGANVIFAHLMAGGVPRSKLFMTLMNRIVKGEGDRHIPSEVFWNSSIGQLCSLSFNEVTAETLKHLIDLSAPLREKIQTQGGQVRYLAYGYHGTEVLVGNQYIWQTYTPYIQGWAKLKLESIAEQAWSRGIKATVYNCPEILTNSSSVFVGVDLSLHPLLAALQNQKSAGPRCKSLIEKSISHLKPEVTPDYLQKKIEGYLSHQLTRAHCDFLRWPQHNTKEQMEFMLHSAEELDALQKDVKNPTTQALSEGVFESCGRLMLHQSWHPDSPVYWLGHDVIAQELAQF